jgi:SAM-dependent methyltransferase
MQALFDYYNTGIEAGRLTRNLCNRLEFESTLHVLAPYLAERQRLLEIGTGPGDYALYYAQQGHQVIAVDLVPAHIALLQERIARGKAGALVAHVADARNLTMITTGSMDIVLCLGPLYHLQLEADRVQCLQEALRTLKPGGILACAYLNRFLIGALAIKRDANKASADFLATLAATGLIQDDPQDWFGLSAYFSTPGEMEALIHQCGAILLDHVAADGASKLIEDVVNRMNEEQYQQWRAWHWQTCRERSILGYSTHGLLIGQKV